MKKIFTLLLSAFLVTTVMAQPTATIKKTDVAPIVDGTVDDVWSTVEPIAIETPHGSETPTVGESWWKMLWNDDGIFLLTFIDDDVFVPAYKGTVPGESWMYDKLEIYFDVNYKKDDAQGAQHNKGHYQIAPTVKEALLEGGATTETRGEVWAFNASDDPKYYAEYFFPFDMLNDQDGVQVDKTEPIGFDVNIMDNDKADLTPSRNRMNWANAGAIAENWANMDDAGLIILDGAQAPTYVDDVKLVAGQSITVDNGTLQMVATITPEDASIKKLNWTVINGTGKATIDQNGLLTAIANGTVSVKAAATDGMGAEAMVDVEISGQVLSQKDVWSTMNLIKNGCFDNGLTSWGNWVDGGEASPGQVAPVIEDGAVVMVPVTATDGAAWHYQLNQNKLQAVMEVPYILAFKAWASGDAKAVVDFEDTSGNNYTRYGVSSHPDAVNGKSEWNFNLTTEPKLYEFPVTFDQILENTDQKVQFMLSLSNQTIYLDSVILVEQAIYEQLPTLPTASRIVENSINKVYPNPVNNTLYVELAAINSKVAIYNSVGQKLIEKTATGNRVQFDVSALRKGMYFIKLEDGSTRKFVK